MLQMQEIIFKNINKILQGADNQLLLIKGEIPNNYLAINIDKNKAKISLLKGITKPEPQDL